MDKYFDILLISVISLLYLSGVAGIVMQFIAPLISIYESVILIATATALSYFFLYLRALASTPPIEKKSKGTS
jgi:hypothetical protein